MSDSENKRTHVRYAVAATAHMSILSNKPLQVEDISTGGFKVTVPRDPSGDFHHRFSLHLPNLHLKELLGKVAWSIENPANPPSWTIGVSMDVHGGDADRLNEELLAAVNTAG